MPMRHVPAGISSASGLSFKTFKQACPSTPHHLRFKKRPWQLSLNRVSTVYVVGHGQPIWSILRKFQFRASYLVKRTGIPPVITCSIRKCPILRRRSIYQRRSRPLRDFHPRRPNSARNKFHFRTSFSSPGWTRTNIDTP